MYPHLLFLIFLLTSSVLSYPSSWGSSSKYQNIGASDCGNNANFPLTPDCRTYHLEVKNGDVANRIIVVGDLKRAEIFSLQFEKITFKRLSDRGFLVITGTYRGQTLSVIGTGMGTPMIDFTIRETRAVVLGKMLMIRIGTCGTPSEEVNLGDVVVVNSSVYVRRDPDYYRSHAPLPYTMSRKVFPNIELSNILHNELLSYNLSIHLGLGATTDSFYSSQGRITCGFDDRNEKLLDELVRLQVGLKSIEMETFHLLDLADVSNGDFVAAAAMLVVAQRYDNTFIDHDIARQREKVMGVAAFDTAVQYKL